MRPLAAPTPPRLVNGAAPFIGVGTGSPCIRLPAVGKVKKNGFNESEYNPAEGRSLLFVQSVDSQLVLKLKQVYYNPQKMRRVGLS